MNIYNYHPTTKIFVAVSEADPDPLEEGNWLIPAFATPEVVPPLAEGQVAVWNGESWDVTLAEDAPTGEAPAPVPDLLTSINRLRAAIDADVDVLTFQVIGNRVQEYIQAEQDALAFQAAGFEGDPPQAVADWIAAAGLSPQEAAEDILAKATQWRSAAVSMRTNRLLKKAQAAQATDINQLSIVQGEWREYIEQMRLLLGV